MTAVLLAQVPSLHPLQVEIVRSPARFKVVVCGRRWGKTRVGGYLALKGAVQGQRVWWVAPVYSQAKIAWRLLRPLMIQIPGVEVRESDRCFLLPGGGEIWIKSADNPDTLRGEGLDGVIIDEADFVEETVWSQALRPALADRKGWAFFISTPYEIGGWFQQLYRRGQANEAGWASWCHPSWTNPYLDHAEINEAKKQMSLLEFRQEFGAEFVGKPDAVYHNFDSRLHVRPTPLCDGQVFVGLDFNNTPRVAVFIQFIEDTLRVVGEIHHATQATTDEHAAMVKKWLENRKVTLDRATCIPDASGSSLRHGGGTDHDDFRDAGFYLDAPAANPAIRDRDNAVLAYLKNAAGTVRTQIDPSCLHLIEAFSKFKHTKRSTSPWGHILDAFGYVAHRLTRTQGAYVTRYTGY